MLLDLILQHCFLLLLPLEERSKLNNLPEDFQVCNGEQFYHKDILKPRSYEVAWCNQSKKNDHREEQWASYRYGCKL